MKRKPITFGMHSENGHEAVTFLAALVALVMFVALLAYAG